MNTQEIRRNFIKYFQENGHQHITSSPVIPHDDPTLLFINAGMNQFKDLFLGKSQRDYLRATTSQKCIRVGGKHNDFENVGHTDRHLTFFEMLGNFSFGDYFKKEAIRFAWEVSTKVFKFDPTRIWPTVFREDHEAFELWKEYVPETRITRFDEEHNFWAMGDTGPCGPCSELYYDRGEKYGKGNCPAEDKDGARFLEFWNLVFMQYNRTDQGILEPLPKPSVDTGAGIERVVSLIMDTESVFETDVLHGLIKEIEKLSGVPYLLEDIERFPAFRVIADHLRTLSFAIADGVQPSNVDRGYVLRKVLRRAVRYGRLLGFEKPFLAQILPRLIELMGEDYPELVNSQGRITEILTTEEEAFLKTLHRGGNILNQIIAHAKNHGKIISGEEAFKLKDTYGLPLEEILLLAKDASLTVDINKYKELEEEAKQRSRQAHKTIQQGLHDNLFADFAQKHGSTNFVGYDQTECTSIVIAIIVNDQFVDQLSENQEGILLLEKTPFYAEMGGQVGDTGIIGYEGTTFHVTDCLSPYKGLIAHLGILKEGLIRIGAFITASVDRERRQKIANNHTATHLLHWALHQVLGEHIKQAGSVVDAHRLRFDFSHHKALSVKELHSIELLVNEKIRTNTPVTCYELRYEEVQKREDIKQFFGDKYDSLVRVIDVDFSKELCGGTHTNAIGNIGYFKIAKESSIAAGIRRIEAVTGIEAEELVYQSETQISDLAQLLATPHQKLMERVEKILEENRQLAQEVKSAKKREADLLINGLINQKEMINQIPFLGIQLELPAKDVNTFMEQLSERMGQGVIVLGNIPEANKCHLIIRVSPEYVSQGIKAIDMIKTLAPLIEGSGGGKAEMAQAGGKAPKNLQNAIDAAKELLYSKK